MLPPQQTQKAGSNQRLPGIDPLARHFLHDIHCTWLAERMLCLSPAFLWPIGRITLAEFIAAGLSGLPRSIHTGRPLLTATAISGAIAAFWPI